MANQDTGSRESYFVGWEVRTEGVILPEHRLPTGPTVLVGLQHVVAMFGAIGLVLAPIAIQSASGIGQGSPDGTAFARWIALITVVAVGLCAVYAPGLARRIPILIGAIVGYVVYYIAANMGYGPPVDFSKV